MKRIVLFSLMAVVTTVSVVLISANTATTTALCEDEPKEGLCQKEAYFQAVLQQSKFETSVGTVTCWTDVEGYSTEPATPKGEPLQGEVYFHFGSCINGAEFCWLPEEAMSPAVFKWTSGANGTVELTEGGKGFKVEITCEKKISCTYTLESSFDINGGKKATIVASKEKMGGATGSNCPGSGAAISWSATYTGGAFFVGATTPSVTLCKKNESPCSVGESYAVPTSLSAALESGNEAKLRLKITEESEATEYTVTCASSTFEGKTTEAGWPTKVEGITAVFGECDGTCAVKVIKGPFAGSVEASGSGNGKLTWAFRLRVRCIGAYKCTYEASSLSNTITGGTPAKMPIVVSLNKLVTGESDAKCGAELTWEGPYRFTKPEAGGEAKMWIVREGI